MYECKYIQIPFPEKSLKQHYILKGFSCRVLVFVLFEKLRNIFIGEIHKSWSGHFVAKTAKQFFPPNLTPGARRQLKYNVQPDCPTKLLQSIWLNKSNREVIWDHFTAVKWHHITSRVSFLVTAFSQWYPHIICNKILIAVVCIVFISFNIFLHWKSWIRPSSYELGQPRWLGFRDLASPLSPGHSLLAKRLSRQENKSL